MPPTITTGTANSVEVVDACSKEMCFILLFESSGIDCRRVALDLRSSVEAAWGVTRMEGARLGRLDRLVLPLSKKLEGLDDDCDSFTTFAIISPSKSLNDVSSNSKPSLLAQ